MILRRFSNRLAGILLVFFVIINSCKKDESSSSGNSNFVSKKLISSYNQDYINSMLNAASALFNINVDLKSFVRTDVELYKVVYETTIEGKKVNASGLVCVPADAGDYPVLSFQNGTNTRHSNAPSEFPSDYGFQMIEVIASMGYVVAIADYPGFGESSQLPHPYLVAEPTVRSLVDLLYAVRGMDVRELPSITVRNEYYLIGYSQGGWATLQLHKALELKYDDDFDLKGSCVGAGPYDIYFLMQRMLSLPAFPMPYYIGYVINGYKSYNQFSNPVSDLLNEPYASRVPSLFNGQLNAGQINAQLTDTISRLMNPEFLQGFATSPKYESVRRAMINNSISPWKTDVPLLMIHGDADTHVDPAVTDRMYSAMIEAGTPATIIKKTILPGADHGEGVIPALVEGFLFLNNIKNSNQ
ncbi:MAG TPA: alpha/beta fold hydrolase [Bacteroidales bacterium]|nr:alpha/beta fold hydrolase [Bacteroidales bacterium]